MDDTNKGAPAGVSFRWEGTEDQEHRELMKACKSRCKQWGKEDCPRPDHWCDECEVDAHWEMRISPKEPRHD